jgi:hypothetical protein
LAAIAIGIAQTRYSRLQTAVDNFKYGMAVAQNGNQAEAVAQRFVVESRGYTSQADAGFFGWLKGVFTGGSSSSNSATTCTFPNGQPNPFCIEYTGNVYTPAPVMIEGSDGDYLQ